MSKIICCVAGRSGGHIIPCLSYAQKLLAIDPDQKILLFSSNTQLDQSITKDNKSITRQVQLPFENIPRGNWLRLPLFVWNGITSAVLSFYFLLKYRPSIIISTGGYVSVPVCLAGWLLSIRTELFELNIVPGKAVSFLSRFVSLVRVCFPEAKTHLKKARCLVSDYPLRPACLAEPCTKKRALRSLGFAQTKKTMLILGGSQGSQSLNKLFLEAAQNGNESWQVIHQVGNSAPEPIKKQYQQLGIIAHVFQFYDHLEQLYPAADVVICRSGAGTLFETAHFQKRCITIPLEAVTTNHQVDNARSFVKQYPHLFTLLRQKEVEHNPQLLYDLVVAGAAVDEPG